MEFMLSSGSAVRPHFEDKFYVSYEENRGRDKGRYIEIYCRTKKDALAILARLRKRGIDGDAWEIRP